MNWFEGEIPAAIQLAKNKHCLIIVYVTGTDEKSKKCDSLWDNEDILTTCRSSDNVALKLHSNSESGKQFSAIYPVVVVPSTFLIGDNGVLIDFIGCDCSQEEFHSQLKAAFEKHEETKAASILPSLNEHTGASPGNEGVGAAGGYSPTPSQLSTEEKVQRAKELIAERQAKKLAEDKEKGKEEEKERRELGKSSGKFQQWKQDEEMKETKKQWQKDKEADRLARERVRAQIAMDRAEKSEAFVKERDAKEKEKREKDEEKKTARQDEEREAKAREERIRSETARIQFRLPDGSSITHNFDSSETFANLDAYISQHTNNAVGTLTLSTPYPRQTFTSEHMGETLRELGLNPSAVILVISGGRRMSPSTSNPIYTLVSFVVAPLSLVWNFIYGVLFGFTTRVSPSHHTAPPSAQNKSGNADNSPIGDTTANRPQTAARRRTPHTISPRTEGNIRRFTPPGDNDDSDDNATWNGNSTQQL